MLMKDFLVDVSGAAEYSVPCAYRIIELSSGSLAANANAGAISGGTVLVLLIGCRAVGVPAAALSRF